jgi:predicted kinase
MSKVKLSRPAIITLLGVPGSGKTYTARQLADLLGIAHVSSDRIREQLFEQPTYSRQEQQIIMQLMLMMTEEFLSLDVPVIFDISLNRVGERRALRDIAKKHDALNVLIWLQIDQQSALLRSKIKDKRRAEDKYTAPMTDQQFEMLASAFQPPQNEDYLVVSGKHSFESQKPAIMRRLRELGLINDELMRDHIAKPEMVNLAAQARAQAGRVDYSRRNIIIR